MLQASAERPAAAAAPASLWVPGMSPQTVDGGSSRAQEIARRREELLGMLHDLPESEYELSLTDLVEKAGAGAGGNGNGSVAPPPSLGEEASPVGTARSASGRQAELQPAAAGRPESWGSARRWDSGSSFRSSSDGVLLNFYMPRSLTRSFTAPRPARSPSVSGGRTASVTSDCNKRMHSRWWCTQGERRRYRQVLVAAVESAVAEVEPARPERAPPNESTVRAASAAILKATNHSAPPAKI